MGQDRRRGRHKRRDTVHFGRTKNGICAGGSVLNSFDESRVSKVVSCSKYEEKEKHFLLLFENTNLKDLVEEVIVIVRFHYETENYQSENPKTEHGILRISKTEKIFSQNFF